MRATSLVQVRYFCEGVRAIFPRCVPYRIILPGDTLESGGLSKSNKPLALGSSEQPIDLKASDRQVWDSHTLWLGGIHKQTSGEREQGHRMVVLLDAHVGPSSVVCHLDLCSARHSDRVKPCWKRFFKAPGVGSMKKSKLIGGPQKFFLP